MKKKPDRRANTQPPPGVERRKGDRRRGTRIVVDLKVDFSTKEMFLYAFITDLSDMGVFILTRSPHPIGTRLTLQFTLPDGEALKADGEVRWVAAPKYGETTTPGMGIQFADPPPDLVEKLSGLVKKVIYFESDTPA